MRLSFEHPLALLLLPVCVGAVYFLWRTSRMYMPPFRRKASLWLRLAVTTLLVLVIASPLAQLHADDLAVAVLLDRSDSISPAMRVEQEQWLARALTTKGAEDRVAVITFGADATLDQALTTDSTPPRLTPADNLRTTRTNIASALRAGVAALPPDAARRIVLLSDGQENLDQADVAAALADAAGVQVLSVPLTRAQGSEVLMQHLEAPTQVREGEQLSVAVHVQSSVVTVAAIHLLVDGRLVVTDEVDLAPGINRFLMTLEPLTIGQHLLRAQVEPDDDTLPQNNGAGALLTVTGPASVLIVEGTQGEGELLAEALRVSGLQVDLASPRTAPLEMAALRGYASVVLANVLAGDLAPGHMQSLQNYVQSFGGGLVVIGGDQSYGPGGYARTQLEEMLPVRMDLRGQSMSTSTALVLAIDVSGSMGGNVGGTTKMELAKEAAISAAELLGEYDQIGILAFDDRSEWVIEPTFASDLDIIQLAIAEMQPRGGTEIHSALRAAFEGIAPVDARVKHIILLTDGIAPDGDYDTLLARINEADVTLSTIAIGWDADLALLERLAREGGGRYHEGNDPFDLPRLVVKETQQVQRAAIVEEEFRPIRISTGPALEGIDPNDMPLLRGYVATSAKPQTTVLLVSRQIDPLLTEWQYGLGRVMAWTSDARNKWSSWWLEWEDFGKFWAQVVKRTARPAEDPNRHISTRIEGDQARITLDAQTGGTDATERAYLNFLPTTGALMDPKGVEQPFSMPQVAPGRYEALLPVSDDGVYLLQVAQTEPDGSQATQSGGFVVPYSPEYRAAGADEPLLEALARRTGGRLVRDPEQAFVRDLPAVGAPRPLWPLLLVLAGILFVGDVGVRRLRITGPEMRGAYYAVRRRMGYVDQVEALARRASASAIQAAPSAVPSAPTLVGTGTPTARVIQPPSSQQGRSSRLLAAKERAARR